MNDRVCGTEGRDGMDRGEFQAVFFKKDILPLKYSQIQ